jgi:F-type H+-transporting ATPase subunit beta
MTVTEDQTTTGVGRIARVTGPVVDVEFPPDAMPAIYNALSVDVSFSAGEGEAETRTLTLEVEQHLGDNMIRAVSLQPTDGLVRGAEVTDSGSPISGPAGDVTKGHVWNALVESRDVPTAAREIS